MLNDRVAGVLERSTCGSCFSLFLIISYRWRHRVQYNARREAHLNPRQMERQRNADITTVVKYKYTQSSFHYFWMKRTYWCGYNISHLIKHIYCSLTRDKQPSSCWILLHRSPTQQNACLGSIKAQHHHSHSAGDSLLSPQPSNNSNAIRRVFWLT